MTRYSRCALTVCLVFLFASAGQVCAQPYAHWSNGPPSPTTATEQTPLPEEIPSQSSPNADLAAARDQFRGRIESGVIPELYSGKYGKQGKRAQSRPGRQTNGPSAGRSTGQRSTAGRSAASRTSDPKAVRAFVDNAFQFDSNDDRLLAAHELANLFLVITTVNQRELEDGSSAVSTDVVDIVDRSLLQQQRVREAQTLFLQLALSFDNDADGQLNRSETSSLAGCLQQNDLSLLNAAQQNSAVDTSNGQQPVIPENSTP